MKKGYIFVQNNTNNRVEILHPTKIVGFTFSALDYNLGYKSTECLRKSMCNVEHWSCNIYSTAETVFGALG